MESGITKRQVTAVIVAGLVGAIGLATAGIGLMWVAGALGISTAAASQIVSAILAGGWALAVVMAIFGAGIIGAIIATVRGLAGRLGQAYAIA
jgi:circularin A/uberolysin family circular bacteriocin